MHNRWAKLVKFTACATQAVLTVKVSSGPINAVHTAGLANGKMNAGCTGTVVAAEATFNSTKSSPQTPSACLQGWCCRKESAVRERSNGACSSGTTFGGDADSSISTCTRSSDWPSPVSRSRSAGSSNSSGSRHDRSKPNLSRFDDEVYPLNVDHARMQIEHPCCHVGEGRGGGGGGGGGGGKRGTGKHIVEATQSRGPERRWSWGGRARAQNKRQVLKTSKTEDKANSKSHRKSITMNDMRSMLREHNTPPPSPIQKRRQRHRHHHLQPPPPQQPQLQSRKQRHQSSHHHQYHQDQRQCLTQEHKHRARAQTYSAQTSG